MAAGESKFEKPSKDIPALVPGVEMADADKPQPSVDETAKKLYQDAGPATFKIGTHSFGSFFGEEGSGYLANSRSEGLTNAHVVSGSEEIFVTTPDGLRHQAKLVDVDDINDIAKVRILDLSSEENHSLPLSAKQLQPGDKGWVLGHPRGANELYVSPGKFLGQSTDLNDADQFVKSIGKIATPEQILEIQVSRFSAAEAPDAKARMLAPYDANSAHIEPGNSGSPYVNSKMEVTGLAKMHIAAGTSGMVPLDAMHSFLDNKNPKFNFEYENKSAASLFKSGLSKHPFHTLAYSASDIVLGGIGLRTASSGRFKGSGVAFGLLAANNIYSDYQNLTHSASGLARTEAGIKLAGDSIALLGSAALTVSKFRMLGKFALGAGAAIHTAANFLPSHLILTKTIRADGSDRPPMPYKEGE